MNGTASIRITIRRLADDGYNDYEDVRVDSWHHDWHLHTDHVPAIGDIVGPNGGGRLYKVIERYWNYPSYGSAAHPVTDTGPCIPRVHLIVEPAAGAYTNERPTIEENQ